MRRGTVLFGALCMVAGAACGDEGGRWSPSDTEPSDVVDAVDADVDAGDADAAEVDVGDPDTSDATETDTGVPSHDEALAQLGVVLDLGGRLDPDGVPVRQGYNPLGTPRRYLHRLSEVYMAGLTPVSGRNQALYEDSSQGHALLYADPADDAWALLPKAATHADIDGDGRDEIIVAILNNSSTSADYGRFYLRVIEDAEEEFAVDEVELTDFSDFAFAGSWDWYKIDVAAGDVDGDGRDELVGAALGSLWVVDDQPSGYVALHAEDFPCPAGVTQYVRVTAGDTDGDGLDEVVAVDGQISGSTGTATFSLYNEALGKETTGTVQVSIDAVPYLLATADPSIGDVDGDGLNEVVFAGHQSTTGWAQVLVMDDARADYEFLPVRFGFVSSWPIVRVETGDFDGDGIDEMVSYREVIDDVNHVGEHGVLELQSRLPHDVHYGNAIAVGDITDDWRDDIFYINGATSDPWLVAWGTDSAGVYRQVWAANVIGAWNYPVLAAPNVDGDSALVEFENHELLFTEPLVLAVLAAPPFDATVETDQGSAGTSFGRASSTGVETEQSLGFTTGFTVGTEFEDRLFTQSKARFTVTVETAMDWTASRTREVTHAYFYNGGGTTDKVVFSTVPFDVYYYRVLSSPVEEEVGTTMVVNLPREPQVLFVDREFFNANNGDFPDVDEQVVPHKVGRPDTYPSSASIDRADLVALGGAYSEPMTVGQGAGSQTIEITVSEGQGQGTSFDLSVTVEAEVGSGGFIFGTSAGFHYGYGYRVTSTNSTIYSGTVGNILEAADWTDHQFDFGLYVRPTRLAGQRFPLIGYWVN